MFNFDRNLLLTLKNTQKLNFYPVKKDSKKRFEKKILTWSKAMYGVLTSPNAHRNYSPVSIQVN